MPLIKCPECSNWVSDKATGCPKCGYPLDAAAAATTSQKAPTAAKNTFKLLSASAVIVLAAALLTFTVDPLQLFRPARSFAAMYSPESPTSEEADEAWSEVDAITDALRDSVPRTRRLRTRWWN